MGAQPGDILATCSQCQRAALFPRHSHIDTRWICDHDATVLDTADPAAIVAFNLARALRWWQWLRQLEAAVWSIPWMASVHVCDDTNSRARALGMRDNVEHVRRHDALIACGLRMSSGMTTEATTMLDVGRPVFQVLGEPNGEPPQRIHPSMVAWRKWVPL